MSYYILGGYDIHDFMTTVRDKRKGEHGIENMLKFTSANDQVKTRSRFRRIGTR